MILKFQSKDILAVVAIGDNQKVVDIAPKILYRFVGYSYHHITDWLREKNGNVTISYLLNKSEKLKYESKDDGQARKPKKRN